MSERPRLAAQLRQRYEKWFRSVRASRAFTPGVIHLGSEAENPVRLCRYQDSTYVDGKASGWSVFIERDGRYEVRVNGGKPATGATLYVKVNDRLLSQPLAAGGDRAVFRLPQGKAVLEIWVQEDGKPRVVHTQNDTAGDVDVRRLD